MLISIITVNYNNLKGLKKTMSSVYEQTWQDFEYIVIDGGSTDGSKAVIEKFKDHIAYWASEPDQGIYNAMNKGIMVAKGDYILFLNSGDTFYDKRALSLFKPFLNGKEKKDLIYGNINLISKTERIKTYPEKLSFTHFEIDTLPHPATLINRSCFDEFLYDEDLKIVSDWKFFMLGICKRKFSYLYINKVIANFYQDGISSIMPELIEKERKKVLDEEFFWNLRFKNMKISILRMLRKILKKVLIKF